MRLVNVRTIDGDIAFLTYERVRDAQQASDSASGPKSWWALSVRRASGRAPEEQTLWESRITVWRSASRPQPCRMSLTTRARETGPLERPLAPKYQ
jgi:hypothetical protein